MPTRFSLLLTAPALLLLPLIALGCQEHPLHPLGEASSAAEASAGGLGTCGYSVRYGEVLDGIYQYSGALEVPVIDGEAYPDAAAGTVYFRAPGPDSDLSYVTHAVDLKILVNGESVARDRDVSRQYSEYASAVVYGPVAHPSDTVTIVSRHGWQPDGPNGFRKAKVFTFECVVPS